MRNLNVKKYALASIAALVFIMGFDYVVHGVLLKGTYEATQHLWRKEADMVCWAMIGGKVLLAFTTAFVFTRGYEGKGIGEGVRFGLLIGLLFAPGHLIMYAVQPLPAQLVGTWIVAGIAEMVGIGIVLSKLYRP